MQVYRAPFQTADAPCALTIGNFDGVHPGHQAMLRQLVQTARARGMPAAVMTFEPHPREFFAPDAAPARLSSLREKVELFKAAGIDRVYVCRFNKAFAAQSAESFIADTLVEALACKYLLVGDDFCFGARRSGDFNTLKQAGDVSGFEVEAMHSVTVAGVRVSSTAVRDALSQDQLALAATLLGRPYSISGRVMHGEKLGRQLGFPTANIQMRHNKPPLNGIFVVEVHGLDDTIHQGVASLGYRPTVNTTRRPTLEVHIFDFGRSIYGAHLRVDFLHKLRDEEKYPDLDTLVQAITRDANNARQYFLTRSGSAVAVHR